MGLLNFEDTREVIRNRKVKYIMANVSKNRNNDLQNTTKITKDRAPRPPNNWKSKLTCKTLKSMTIKPLDIRAYSLTGRNLWWKESLNNDGHQFHQYQENEQSPVILIYWTHKNRMHCISLRKYRLRPLAWCPGTNSQPSLELSLNSLHRLL